MSEDLWRWWEEQHAPDINDLYKDEQTPYGGCVAAVICCLMMLILLTMGAGIWAVIAWH